MKDWYLVVERVSIYISVIKATVVLLLYLVLLELSLSQRLHHSHHQEVERVQGGLHVAITKGRVEEPATVKHPG